MLGNLGNPQPPNDWLGNSKMQSSVATFIHGSSCQEWLDSSRSSCRRATFLLPHPVRKAFIPPYSSMSWQFWDSFWDLRLILLWSFLTLTSGSRVWTQTLQSNKLDLDYRIVPHHGWLIQAVILDDYQSLKKTFPLQRFLHHSAAVEVMRCESSPNIHLNEMNPHLDVEGPWGGMDMNQLRQEVLFNWTNWPALLTCFDGFQQDFRPSSWRRDVRPTTTAASAVCAPYHSGISCTTGNPVRQESGWSRRLVVEACWGIISKFFFSRCLYT